MDYSNILFQSEGAIATIIINRPKALNALNKDTLEELLHCLSGVGANREISCVIITGSGEKAFVAGADISFMQNLDAEGGRTMGQLGQKVMHCVEELPQPVIGAINGFALGGGCELALACDIRLCSENAKFGQPEVNLGIIPGFGGTQRLPRLVGKGIASELLFSGRMIDAQEALRIGLVNKVVPQEELLASCKELANLIDAKGGNAVRLCKEVVNNGMELDLKRACSYEADIFGLCFGHEEQKEGMTAFLEKRPPNFKK